MDVSVIIPTHNRCNQLRGLLLGLADQTTPASDFEVVVVADSCTDSTLDMLAAAMPPYKLTYVAHDGRCAAAARNRGAQLASGELLVFIDDDVEPHVSLISEHVRSHAQPNRVVIGYLKYDLPANADIYTIKLWAWWEDKFSSMSQPGYWHQYEDLLSGNFSVPADLFREAGGGSENLKCREDYEFGARLLKMEADFFFNRNAWGYHRDVTTDLVRSLARKKSEGAADIQLGVLHPELVTRMRLARYRNTRVPRSNQVLYFLVSYMPGLTDAIAATARFLTKGFEALRMRKKWEQYSRQLHEYWYLRGVLSAVGSRKKLIEYFKARKMEPAATERLRIDLSEGITAAMQHVDALRPESIEITYKSQLIGKMGKWHGAERLRGVHLQSFLATHRAWHLMQAMTIDALTDKKTVREKNNYDKHLQ